MMGASLSVWAMLFYSASYSEAFPLKPAISTSTRSYITRVRQGDPRDPGEYGPGSQFPIDQPSSSAAMDYISSLRRDTPHQQADAPPPTPQEKQEALARAIARQQQMLGSNAAAPPQGFGEGGESEGQGGSRLRDIMARGQASGVLPPRTVAASGFAAADVENDPLRDLHQEAGQVDMGGDPYEQVGAAMQENLERNDGRLLGMMSQAQGGGGVEAAGGRPQEFDQGRSSGRFGDMMSAMNRGQGGGGSSPYDSQVPDNGPEHYERAAPPAEEERGGESRFAGMFIRDQSGGMVGGGMQATPAPVDEEPASGPRRYTPQEKMRLNAEAIARQTKYMEAQSGIDFGTATGEEIAKARMKVRLEQEAVRGFVPSTGAANDYMRSLKVDSSRKHEQQQAEIQAAGNAYVDAKLPGASTSADDYMNSLKADSTAKKQELEDRFAAGAQGAPVKPPLDNDDVGSFDDRITVMNTSDQYIASLKGHDVELHENPYLKKEEASKPIAPPPIPAPAPAPKQPPQLSYAEQLAMAKRGERNVPQQIQRQPQAAPAPAPAPVIAEGDAAAVQQSPLQVEGPPPAPVAAVSYKERLAAAKAGKATAPPPQQPIPASKAAPAPAQLPQDIPGMITVVMDLLTQNVQIGLQQEDRQELSGALMALRDGLRHETMGPGYVPPTPAPVAAVATPPPPAPVAPAPVARAPAAPAFPTVAASAAADDDEPFRRANALLMGHLSGGLHGPDLLLLKESLAACLEALGEVPGGQQPTSAASAFASTTMVTPEPEPPTAAAPSNLGGMQSVGSVANEMGLGAASPEEFRATMNKALGYLLKHKGGPGYGAGRLKQREAEIMVEALTKVISLLRAETA
ncbi:unnamed protein product [Chrysoparadoxa australica]